MRRSAARLLIVASLALVAVEPTVVHAKGAYPNTVQGALHDCGAGHDPLMGHYTVAVLHQALKSLTTSNSEYTTCAQALDAAIRALLGKGTHPAKGASGPPDAKGATGPKPGLLPGVVKIASAVQNGRGQRGVSGGIPGTAAAIVTRNAGFLSSIPTPILIVLAALLAAAAAFGGLALRNLVRARRST